MNIPALSTWAVWLAGFSWIGRAVEAVGSSAMMGASAECKMIVLTIMLNNRACLQVIIGSSCRHIEEMHSMSIVIFELMLVESMLICKQGALLAEALTNQDSSLSWDQAGSRWPRQSRADDLSSCRRRGFQGLRSSGDGWSRGNCDSIRACTIWWGFCVRFARKFPGQRGQGE